MEISSPQRAGAVIKDSNVNVSTSFYANKTPSKNKDIIFPQKGNVMYNIPNEINGQDGYMWYGDGYKWIPFASSVNITGTGGIVITTTNGVINWDGSGVGAAVTLTSAGGIQTLVNDGVGPTLATKGLTAGSGIVLTSDAVSVTINNSDPGSAVTLTSAGGVQTLVNDGVGPALATKGLTAGTGISLGSDTLSVTINNSDPGSAVTLTNVGTDVSNVTLPVTTTGPNMTVKGVGAGNGLHTTQANNTIIFSTNFTADVINGPASNQLYIVPVNCIMPMMSITAGGGAGGPGDGGVTGGGGGGSGGQITNIPLQPGDEIHYTLGAGGSGITGVIGNPGTLSNFFIVRGASQGPTFTLGGGQGGNATGAIIGGAGIGGVNSVPAGFVAPFSTNGTGGGTGGAAGFGGVAGGATYGSPYLGGDGGAGSGGRAGGGGGGATWLGIGGHGIDGPGGGSGGVGVAGGGGGGGASGQPGLNGGNGQLRVTYYM